LEGCFKALFKGVRSRIKIFSESRKGGGPVC
jgi:hypothetical protein